MEYRKVNLTENLIFCYYGKEESDLNLVTVMLQTDFQNSPLGVNKIIVLLYCKSDRESSLLYILQGS